MYIDKDFTPVLRFMVVSDIHYHDEPRVENERFEKAVKIAYRLSEAENYKNLDAIYIVGDFATSGSEKQMLAIKKTLDDNVKPGTQVCLTMASHEFSRDNGGEEGALERFARIFNMPPDDHRIINGFHFISLTTTNGCRFDSAKKEYAKQQLEIAAKDKGKPIFFFQHPHITDTVYGSIDWGEKDLTPILVNYPQIIDFSGHSHAPVNDPRSIHQEHFTSLGTGTLSYFELDEYEKVYGTVPPDNEKAAQMLIVEADAKGRVRVYPYDVLTDSFFRKRWAIDEAWNPDSFIYTDERWKNTYKPFFPDSASVEVKTEDGTAAVTFTQAVDEEEGYVNDYFITIFDSDGFVTARQSVWSEYYFADMPEKLTVKFTDLESGKYTARIETRSFWHTFGRNCLTAEFEIK